MTLLRKQLMPTLTVKMIEDAMAIVTRNSHFSSTRIVSKREYDLVMRSLELAEAAGDQDAVAQIKRSNGASIPMKYRELASRQLRRKTDAK